MDGALVGIAFQSYKRKDLEKAGYVVPIPIIRHMLDDLEDGAIAGVPDLGVYWQKLENAALRDYLGLAPDNTGIRVSRVLHGSSADGVLEIDDVIVAIDGAPVASDGTVQLRDQDRVMFHHLVTTKQIGDRVELAIVRRAEPQHVAVALAPYVALVPLPRPDRRPSYVMFAGLLFTPLSYEYMMEWEWAKEHHRYQSYYHEVFPSPRRREVVLIREVLAHEINLGYHQMADAVVERINGIDITEMRDVARALAAPLGKFHVIETDYHGPRSESRRVDYHSSYGTRIVLDATACERATAEIMEQQGIPHDRSKDLR
jgi:hypothetical protein